MYEYTSVPAQACRRALLLKSHIHTHMHVTCMKDATADHRSGRDVYGGIFQSIQSSVEYFGADTAAFFRSKDPYKVIQTKYQHPGSFSWTKQWAAAGIINSLGRTSKLPSVKY